MTTGNGKDIESLYAELMDAWNSRDARRMADLFTPEGEMIGFDGSLAAGPEDIYGHLKPVFDHHPTAPYITKIKTVSLLNEDAALLRAIAGMIPPGRQELNPAVNAHHTLVAAQGRDGWQIRLFQNTPAQFHGRPELVEQMTQELSEVLHQER
ncbi:SgcJ/EcaC family oxidoreductase [Paenibacillus sp. HN-1]|uniref:SgcJ/EcaC family oxidoreductase n=1 Tax=Paenibacillus TaxID=44249 RepID=UPI001CA7DAAC|nr:MULTISPECIES: SgcJ/EcaC family oxidoreductase [Paenibacillus]MBY9080221.1 SgcJ/EcaC family oxidoreductase [Paenibacillus sp. CGMCC 1.18879]MBY9083120.1 SgcJ/EcaC family oxidoreductase [Paenibacillus sinensis]